MSQFDPELIAAMIGKATLTDAEGRGRTWTFDVPTLRCQTASDGIQSHIFFAEGGLCECGALQLDAPAKLSKENK